MNSQIKRVALLAAGLLLATLCLRAQPAPKGAVEIPIAKVAKYIPSAVKATKKSDVLYELTDSQKKVVGKLLCSTPIADNVLGYADAVPVLVVMDTKDVVAGIVLLSNNETPEYLKKVEKAGFLKRWDGKSAKDANDLKVDAVSGATFTSKAIKENVSIVLKKYLSTASKKK